MSEELEQEKITLPSGQEVVIQELLGNDILAFMDKKASGNNEVTLKIMTACCHAPKFTEEELRAMKGRDFMALLRAVNVISGMVDADPTSGPETS